MKNFLYLALATAMLCGCTKSTTSPSTSPTGTSNTTTNNNNNNTVSWDGTYYGFSEICSNSQYNSTVVAPVTISNVNNVIHFNNNAFNYFVSPCDAMVSGSTATISSFNIDLHHFFNGGVLTLSGNKITFTYSFTCFYNNGTVQANPQFTVVWQKM